MVVWRQQIFWFHWYQQINRIVYWTHTSQLMASLNFSQTSSCHLKCPMLPISVLLSIKDLVNEEICSISVLRGLFVGYYMYINCREGKTFIPFHSISSAPVTGFWQWHICLYQAAPAYTNCTCTIVCCSCFLENVLYDSFKNIHYLIAHLEQKQILFCRIIICMSLDA